MKISERLEKAKKKIINQDNWFPGYFRSSDLVIDRFNRRDKCHCAITAIDDDSGDYFNCLKILRQAIINFEHIETDQPVIVHLWNDSTTHDNVVKVYDIAIDLAKELE